MALIYVAHPYFDVDPEQMQLNRKNAAAWALWIAKTFGVAVSANWIWWTEFLQETPENRDLGLHCDDQEIAKCNEFWMVGGRTSLGVRRGRDTADKYNVYVRDLTAFGFAAPTVGNYRPWLDDFVKGARIALQMKGLIP